jgi:hypothetical protein
MSYKFNIGKLEFRIDFASDTISLVSADKDISKVFLGETINYQGKTYKLTVIEYYAFKGCSELTSVTIPNSVEWIGLSAFEGCSSLISITIPNSVTRIDELY